MTGAPPAAASGKFGHELVERCIDMQVDADKTDHLAFTVPDGDGARLHQGAGAAASKIALGVILAGALDVFEHPQCQIGDGRPEGTSGVKAVGDLDHRLVQIFQGVEHHFTMLAEQFGQAVDEPIV